MRIVSLLPSATDIVLALGAGDHLVGVSHSCSGYPGHLPELTNTWIDQEATSAQIDEQVRNAAAPLYELDIDTLQRLAPDVVVSQSLCDVCAVPSGDVLEAVSSLPGSPQLVDLTPNQLKEIPDCFQQVGAAIGQEQRAARLIEEWRKTFECFYQRHVERKPRVAFLDWLDPPFVAGHWMPDMLAWLGVESVLGVGGRPSYSVTWEALDAADPDLIIAACCGFDVDRAASEASAVSAELVCLDGYQHFNRPSPTLMHSLGLLSETIEAHIDHGG